MEGSYTELHPGRMVVEFPRQSRALAQMLGQGLDPDGLGSVVAGVNHVQTQLGRIEISVRRAFAGDVGVTARRVGLADGAAGATRDHADSADLLGSARNQPNGVRRGAEDSRQ